MGTYSQWFQNGRNVVTSITEALQQREDLQAIVQIGNVADAESFGGLTERIHLVKRIPQLSMLVRADILITNGGFSSTWEACYFGVPVVVFLYCNNGFGNVARLSGDFANVSSSVVLDLLK
ncbi:DUF354 domain-containing protein [Stutzerimonas kirkiae]|uniref:glycosyltransferase n=1 Tax=Stutzerimonas kirkiae TaxID=2211392 RepID=UPI0013F177D1